MRKPCNLSTIWRRPEPETRHLCSEDLHSWLGGRGGPHDRDLVRQSVREFSRGCFDFTPRIGRRGWQDARFGGSPR